MKIEVLTLCHNYQRRLCWDLSSLAEQQLPPNVKVIPFVCAFAGNGKPTTEATFDAFNGKLHGKVLCYNPHDEIDVNRFAHRGYTRNDQVKAVDEDTDWVLFSDCDMVYEPMFFAELAERVGNLADTEGVICVGRKSNDALVASKLVNDSALAYPYHVKDAAARIAAISNREMGNVGAGYFQMVRKDLLKGYYIEEGTSRDRHMFKSLFLPKSDMQFKKRFGHKKIKLRLNARQYHINHTRDPEMGQHVEEQR